jgi:hypothetical protein
MFMPTLPFPRLESVLPLAVGSHRPDAVIYPRLTIQEIRR